MSKKRRSVSLEPKVHEYLSREEVNASALVNDLVRRHMDGAAEDAAIIELRKQQVESEVDHLRARTESKLNELEQLEEKLQTHSSQRRAELENALEKLQSVPQEPSNPAIRTHADKLDMTPEQLIEKIDEYGGDDE